MDSELHVGIILSSGKTFSTLHWNLLLATGSYTSHWINIHTLGPAAIQRQLLWLNQCLRSRFSLCSPSMGTASKPLTSLVTVLWIPPHLRRHQKPGRWCLWWQILTPHLFKKNNWTQKLCVKVLILGMCKGPCPLQLDAVSQNLQLVLVPSPFLLLLAPLSPSGPQLLWKSYLSWLLKAVACTCLQSCLRVQTTGLIRKLQEKMFSAQTVPLKSLGFERFVKVSLLEGVGEVLKGSCQCLLGFATPQVIWGC